MTQEEHEQMKATAYDLLDDAARVRPLAQKKALAMLESDRREGKIASRTSNEELDRRALNDAFHTQSSHLLQQGLTTNQFNHLERSIAALEHKNGAGWTEDYGNLGSGKAAQRGRNTKLEKPRTLQTVENMVELEDR
jgi:hypothetical protein